MTTFDWHARRVSLALLLMVSLPAGSQERADPLFQNFKHPPSSAAPRVWWHWMNGNITEEGIRLDLEWMHQVGLGGAQVFEGDLGTPKVVPETLTYLSLDWQHAFRTADETAKSLGLELTITSAPGWSSAGGPWVTPADAMKKLVWSEASVAGGTHFQGKLPRPPDVPGPFQQIPKAAVTAGSPGDLPRFYRDSALLAFRDHTARVGLPVSANSPAGGLDVRPLEDGDFQSGVQVPIQANKETWIDYRFKDTQRVSAVTVGLPLLQGFGSQQPPLVVFQMSEDGVEFHSVATLSTTSAAVRSASFPAIHGKIFRLLLKPDTARSFRDRMAPAPGVVKITFGPPPSAYTVTEWQLYGDARVHAFAEKAGFSTAPDYYALDTPRSVENPTLPEEVIELTRLMQPDGTLDWKAPPGGTWTILRLGYSLTGQRNHPAPQVATGLEVDKLNGAAVDRYFDAYLSKYDGMLKSSGAVNSLLTDSIESESQNWTEDFVARFRELRGYDPMRWLPALTGVVVGSAEASDRFLWDIRKTIADLYASDYYGRTAAKAHARGWSYYAEALEDHRPQLGDDMQMRRPADIPMGAMWMFPKDGHPEATYVADLQGAASVAHIYGKPYVAAESMTAFGHPWAFSPRDLKRVADLELSLGVTRFAIHDSAHQPLIDHKPGLALSPLLGQYFNRNETWAPLAGAWVSYLSRSSYLLQQGKPFSQIAYFFGEEAPLVSLFGDAEQTEIPQGFPFDFFDSEALLTCLSADADGIRSCGGTHYQVLYLGGSSRRLSLRVLTKLSELVESGAILVGMRPSGSPSLADQPGAFRKSVDALFGPQGAQGPRSVGRGVVVEDQLESALKRLHIDADWSWQGSRAEVRVIHRHLAEGEVYFLSNQSGQAAGGELSLLAMGRRPEIWRAENAQIEKSDYRSEGGRTHIPVSLRVDESLFIVFRQEAVRDRENLKASDLRRLLDLSEIWSLKFPGASGLPARKVSKLDSWSESTDPEMKYFSGTGSYTTHMVVAAQWLARKKKVYLDLGQVDDIAEVTLNGRSVGIGWHAPYRLEVTSLLKAGRNELTIAVTNLWVNRLIGDAQPGAHPHTFTTGPTYTADAPLRSSGLLGPVRLLGSDE